MKDIEEVLFNEVIKISEPLNIRIIECSAKRGKNGLNIKVVIDKDSGVTIDDCEKITRLFNSRVEILEIIGEENYNLQVSSPGIDREFKDKKEYNIFISRDVVVTLKEPLDDGNTNTVIKGKLLGMKNGIVNVDVSGKILTIPLKKIHKAKLDG